MDTILERNQTQKTQEPNKSFAPIRSIPQLTHAFAVDNNKILQQFFPLENNFNIEWMDLQPTQEISIAVATRTTMLFVCSGTGQLTGENSIVVTAGGSLVIPPTCETKLINTSSELLKVLKLSFDQDADEFADTTPHVTLQDLLDYNKQRVEQHVQSSLFKMLEDGTLEDPEKLDRFLGCLYAWSRYFQRVMFCRQATCTDEHYQDLFLQHLQEEIGHDHLLINYKTDFPNKDFIFRAVATWFAYKMLVLDNIGKTAVVHLVLEASADQFYPRARKYLKPIADLDYFSLHDELDDGHAELGIDLLKHQHHSIYARTLEVVKDAWDMFETLMDRMVYLVKK